MTADELRMPISCVKIRRLCWIIQLGPMYSYLTSLKNESRKQRSLGAVKAELQKKDTKRCSGHSSSGEKGHNSKNRAASQSWKELGNRFSTKATEVNRACTSVSDLKTLK